MKDMLKKEEGKTWKYWIPPLCFGLDALRSLYCMIRITLNFLMHDITTWLSIHVSNNCSVSPFCNLPGEVHWNVRRTSEL